MRFRLILIVVLSLMATVELFAQEIETVPDEKLVQSGQTQKIDEFGPLKECDFKARVDGVLVSLLQNTQSKGYIIIYRGAEDLPSRQTERFLQTQIKYFEIYIKQRGFDLGRITIIDGGFRKLNSYWSELFLVPENDEIPRPTKVVPAPIPLKNKAIKVDQGFPDFEAALWPDEEIPDEDKVSPEIESEEIENESEITENENEKQETSFNESEENIEEETEEYIEYPWFSDYFVETLNAEPDSRGVIVYYIDDDEFDPAKARQLIEKDLVKYAEKLKFDQNRVKLVYGGYRKGNEADFWIVPKDAVEPEPEPEIKVVEKDQENPKT